MIYPLNALFDAKRLSGRATSFLALMIALTICLLILGNIQQFTRASQLLLLRILNIASLAEIICAVYHAVLAISLKDISQTKEPLLSTFGALVIAAISLVIAIVSRLLILLFQ